MLKFLRRRDRRSEIVRLLAAVEAAASRRY
jgi:hypothetical protein